jgi:ribosomal protein S18 acetylase RimI-like enzyme
VSIPDLRITDLPEDLFAAAVGLWHEAGLTRPWNDPLADLRRAMCGPSSTVLACCDDDGRLIATAMVGHDGHRGWVYYLAVTATERGNGIGHQLMRACEDWIRERGIPKIQVMVRQANEEVVSFYERLGYADGEVRVLGRFLD